MKKIQLLLDLTSEHLELLDIFSNSRKIEYIEARALMYTVLRKYGAYTLTDIAKIFSKNHATIMHALKGWPYMVRANPSLEAKYNQIVLEWNGSEEKKPKNILNLLQKRVKNLEKQNEILNLNNNDLKKRLKTMVWAKVDCRYSVEDIDKILNYKTWPPKKKIDTLLHIDCNLYCNLGQDSSLRDRSEVKQKSKLLYRTIKKIDATVGTLLLTSMD